MTEVCSVVDVNQFAAGTSTDKCGFFGVALLKYAGKPGQSPTGSPSDVWNWASNEYVRYDGPDVPTNYNGMTVPMLYQVLADAGLHYQGIGAQETGFQTDHLTVAYVRSWVRAGYPVIISVAEDDVFDCDLGAKPYNWNTSGYYHIIVATGVASDGNILVHDTANIGPSGVRPGPRRYDINHLINGITSATAVVLPWMTRPDPSFDPTKEGNLLPMVPTNWHDDGTTLTDPKGNKFNGAVRTTILASNWDGDDVLQAQVRYGQPGQTCVPEDGRWGMGDVFYFLRHVIVVAWKPDPALTGGKARTNVTFIAPAGYELYYCRNLAEQLQKQANDAQATANAAKANAVALQAEVTQLQAQLAAAQKPVDNSALKTTLQTASDALTAAIKEL